jgi:hypothetical protein
MKRKYARDMQSPGINLNTVRLHILIKITLRLRCLWKSMCDRWSHGARSHGAQGHGA